MLTSAVLKSYLSEMPRGHIFDLSYAQFAGVFSPGEPDAAARAKRRAFAEECDCDFVNNQSEGRFELKRR
jgi:hypothetical protein